MMSQQKYFHKPFTSNTATIILIPNIVFCQSPVRIKILDIPLIPELFRICGLFRLPPDLRSIMFDQPLQLLNLHLIQLQLLLFLFQYQQLPFLLLPLLVKFLIDHRYLLLPVFFYFFLLLLQIADLLLKLLDHLWRYHSLDFLVFVSLLVLRHFLFHLLYLVLFDNVLLVVSTKDSLVLHQLLTQILGLLFHPSQLRFELDNLGLVFVLVLH